MNLKKIIYGLPIIWIFVGCAINTIEYKNNGIEAKNINTNNVDSISVKGIIIDEVPGHCGVYCNGGMIKVKLDKKISFRSIDTFQSLDTIYVVTVCVTMKGYKGNRINVKATKLVETDKECYYRNYFRLDNHVGMTFKLSEQESKRI